jgi:hypothetical protein
MISGSAEGWFMRIFFLGVMVIGVVALGPAAPNSSLGSEPDVKATEKKETPENQRNLEQPDQNEATATEVKDSPGDKPAATADTVKTKGHKKEVTAGEPKSSSSAEEDRPWLIKERFVKKSGNPKKKPATLIWENDEQRLQCETLLRKLQKTLGKARTYSIRGDTCATARHADGFLNLEKRLRNECPERYLENNGYSEKIIQNVKVLWELGKKACLEK